MSDMANIQTKYPISINFINTHETVSFSSFEEVKEWIKNERAAWQEMRGAHNATRQNIERLDELNRAINNSSTESQIDSFARDYIPSSVIRIFYNQIFNNTQLNDNTFNNFCQGLFNWNTNVEVNRIGAMAYVLLKAGLLPLSLVETSEKLQKESAEAVANAKISETTLQKKLKETETELSLLKKETETELSRLKKEYANELALQAPTAFWQEREARFFTLANRSWWSWVCSLATIILLFLLLASYLLFSKDEIDPIKAVPYTILFASIVSLIVWFSRTMLKDHRTYSHLISDANERITMIKTYSVLKDNGLEGNDLSTILAALYRPASTGIVDETGPALPMEIVLKNITKLSK